MVPSLVIQVPVIPKTANGKANKRALPDPEWKSDEGFQAPVSEAEIRIAAMWKKLLKIDQVGRADNFFNLGGHSLLTIRLVKEIEMATGVQLTIADVFDNPTLAELSELLKDVDYNAVGTEPSTGLLARMRRAVAGLFGN